MSISSEYPQAFGRYTLLALLGKGGMGELYLGRLDGVAGWEKDVAIKKVLPHLSGDDEFLKRFIDEAKIAVTLSHGNIVSVFDLGQVDGELYIAMEFVDGWDLRQIIKFLRAKGDHVPDRLAAHLCAEICKGLAYAHERNDADGQPLGIVHRDVSPSNILVSKGGEVKITDFGIATAATKLGRTVTGQLKGKFNYMSPEQALGKKIDARSDVFSVGVVLYELLTGERPFEGDSDMDTLARVQKGDRPTIDELRPDLPERWVEVVEKALAHSMDDRFVDAEALHVELVRLNVEDTGPVTSRELGKYLVGTEVPQRMSTSKSGPGLDTLLNQQLEGMLFDPGSSPSGSDVRLRQRKDSDGFETTMDYAPERIDSQPARTPGRVEETITQTPSVTDVSIPRAEQPISDELRAVFSEVVDAANAPADEAARRKVGIPLWLAVGALLLVVAGAAFGIGMLLRPTEIAIEAAPPGAAVYVDDEHVGASPITVEVEPGTHEVVARSDDNIYEFEPVDARRGRTTTATLLAVEEVEEPVVEPEPVVEEPEVRLETVILHVSPTTARISINGRPGFPPGPARIPLDRPVTLSVSADGYLPWEEERTFTEDDLIGAVQLPALVPDPTLGLLVENSNIEPEGEESDGRDEDREDDEPDDDNRDEEPDDRDEDDESDDREAEDDSAPVDDPAQALDENQPMGRVTIRFLEQPMYGRIAIDGTDYGQSNNRFVTFEVPVGSHEIFAEHSGAGVSDVVDIHIANEGDTAEVNIDWR